MQFHEKLQELRKQKGLTQEMVAEALFVSRTAVSKWESGRGYPNIDSLKAIAKLYSVTVDDLLSGEQLLAIAQEDSKKKENSIRDLVFGLLDVSALMLLFLPIFAQRGDENVVSVSLLMLSAVSPWLKYAFFDFIISTAMLGVLILGLQNSKWAFWLQNKHKVSLLLSVLCVLLFVVCLQPYPAIIMLLFAVMKVFMLLKR